MAIDIGIRDKDRKAIAEGLGKLLADSYTLYLKTHNYHWNVTGPMFNTLHLMFEQQYTELALAVDLVAERNRALGYPAPGSYKAYAKLTGIEEETGVPSAEDMIRAARCTAMPPMSSPRSSTSPVWIPTRISNPNGRSWSRNAFANRIARPGPSNVASTASWVRIVTSSSPS